MTAGWYWFRVTLARRWRGYLGVAVLLGVRTRTALFLTGLIYLSLSFGLMAVQEAEGVAWLGIHIGLIAAALVLVRHDRFALWGEKYN